MRNLIRILIVFLFILPISKSLAHEKIANSTCNLFIKNIIDNYDLIKDHYWMGSTDLKYGFLLEETWDSDLSYADDEGNETFGDTKLRRDEDGNIFISNIFASYAFKVNLKPGDKIIEINKKQAKDYSDNEIDEIFSDEEKKVEITYINQQNKKVTEELERFEIHITRKYLNFKINNFNSINNQTFETDFIVNYHIQAELYDGITKDDYDDMDNDNLFKIVKENFYKKDEEDEWYNTCEYTDDELNQMQLISPSWTVGLLNLSFQSDDTSETTTSFKIYDELTGSDFESIDIISTFDGQIKVKNKFDHSGWFKCVMENGVYTKIVFGRPVNFKTWIEYVISGDIYFDSGMYQGNKRPY